MRYKKKLPEKLPEKSPVRMSHPVDLRKGRKTEKHWKTSSEKLCPSEREFAACSQPQLSRKRLEHRHRIRVVPLPVRSTELWFRTKA